MRAQGSCATGAEPLQSEEAVGQRTIRAGRPAGRARRADVGARAAAGLRRRALRSRCANSNLHLNGTFARAHCILHCTVRVQG